MAAVVVPFDIDVGKTLYLFNKGFQTSIQSDNVTIGERNTFIRGHQCHFLMLSEENPARFSALQSLFYYFVSGCPRPVRTSGINVGMVLGKLHSMIAVSLVVKYLKMYHAIKTPQNV